MRHKKLTRKRKKISEKKGGLALQLGIGSLIASILGIIGGGVFYYYNNKKDPQIDTVMPTKNKEDFLNQTKIDLYKKEKKDNLKKKIDIKNNNDDEYDEIETFEVKGGKKRKKYKKTFKKRYKVKSK